jgi:hypothetical protein
MPPEKWNLPILNVMADARHCWASLPVPEEEANNASATMTTFSPFLESPSLVRQLLGHARRRAKIQT